MATFNDVKELGNLGDSDVEQQNVRHGLFEVDELYYVPDIDYSKRSQWLRAAILGAINGLVSTASLMMGIGAVKQDVKPTILAGFVVLVVGACSKAVDEYISVYFQLQIELAQMKRNVDNKKKPRHIEPDQEEEEKEGLPNPVQAAAASALAFSVGAMVPLLAGSFIREYKVRIWAVVGAVTFALIVFGWLGAYLGKWRLAGHGHHLWLD